MTIMNQLFWRV